MKQVDSLRQWLATPGDPARELFQNLMVDFPVWVSLLTSDGRILFINWWGKELLGRGDEELLGLSLKEIFPPAPIPDWQGLFPAGEGRAQAEFAMRIRNKTGKEHDLKVFLKRLGDPRRGYPWFIGMFQEVGIISDFPEREKAEDWLDLEFDRLVLMARDRFFGPGDPNVPLPD